MGDVLSVYSTWMQRGVGAGDWVGIDRPWVYPILAAVPMLLARVGGPEHYGTAWLTIVLLLDAAALAVLTRGGRRELAAAWWWLAFLVVLGPIAVGRIDAVTVALALVGLLLLTARPTLAAALLTVAAWVKVWPAALVVAALIAVRRRRDVLTAAVTTSVVVVAISLVLGSGATVLGFVGQQAGRGLQVESLTAVPWLWRAASGAADTTVYYDRDILTFQVSGPGVALAAQATTVVMALVVLAVVLLGLRAVRSGASAERLLAPLSLGLVTALIVTNKVGSPQFVSWLAVPVVVGLVLQRRGGPSFVVPAALSLVVAGLTQVIYPWCYDSLLAAEPWIVLVATLRGVAEVGLLALAAAQLWRLGRTATAGRGRMGA
ncbi:DUF2029 domain-containing protein [Frigoribacterium sp. CFBP 13707]|nr:DUF2029 domain-containing protein [Frigoribacterium sp. CFBP 13707]